MNQRSKLIVGLLSIVVSVLLESCSFSFESQLPGCVETDCDCADFATQEEAQKVFDSFNTDKFKLDGDGNGVACESLPKMAQNRDQSSEKNVNLKLGNPSKANQKDPDNYLIDKPQLVISYNCSSGIPNWVSWQLNKKHIGSVQRTNEFKSETNIPENCYIVKPTDYQGSSYDRGHMVPSADRTRTQEDNQSTFVMSNIIPQSPENNRETWRELEEYSRDLVFQGKELYIIAGGYGKEKAIASGKIVVPTYTWKIVVVLDKPGEAIDENTRVIAVMIPNDSQVANSEWQDYQVSVDEIERKTGYDFLSNLSKKVQNKIESKVRSKKQ